MTRRPDSKEFPPPLRACSSDPPPSPDPSLPDTAPRDPAAGEQDRCPICDRALVPGPSVNRHHWRPLSRGGRDSSAIHVICHRMIHRLFTERDLATAYATAAALRAHPEMRRFIDWVRGQPATYVDWPRSPKGGQKGRRSRGRR